VLENGPVVRRRDLEEKKRLERLEEERRRKIWQETPKRFKGLMSGKCIRRYGKFIIVLSYRSSVDSLSLSFCLSLSLSHHDQDAFEAHSSLSQGPCLR
jgi:hypothetical protein